LFTPWRTIGATFSAWSSGKRLKYRSASSSASVFLVDELDTFGLRNVSMSQIGETKHVRIDKRVYDELVKISKKTGYSAAELVTMCVEDCLKAYRAKRPITPQMVLLERVRETGAQIYEEAVDSAGRAT
jgi:hypothetical protein